MKSNIVPLLLREVTPKQVTIMEELGRGAYGKVRKAVMKDLPKKEVFSKPREERVDMGEGRVVAIKVLLGEKILYVLFKVDTLLGFLRHRSKPVLTPKLETEKKDNKCPKTEKKIISFQQFRFKTHLKNLKKSALFSNCNPCPSDPSFARVWENQQTTFKI